MARSNPRAIVVTIAILVFLFYPSSQPAAYAPSTSERRRAVGSIERQVESLAALNSSQYGDFNPVASDDSQETKWLNLTGFRQTDGYAWGLLQPTQDKARAYLQRAAGSQAENSLESDAAVHLLLYQNITGDVRGTWIRSPSETNVARPTVNLTVTAPDASFSSSAWERNITGKEGTLQIRFVEEESTTSSTTGANSLSAIMAIQDEMSSGGGWDVALHGVHLVESGSIILTTKSNKYAGIFGLPHLALSSTAFAQMQTNINVSMSDALDKRLQELNAASSIEFEVPNPKCEMVAYLQQHTFDKQSPNLDGLRAIEHELRFPSGSLPAAPLMTMSLALFSPDCGFAIESKGPPYHLQQEANHLRGHKTEVSQRIVRNVLLAVSVLMAAQLLLLMRQMRVSSTPSRQSKISLRTMTTLAMGDYIVLLLSSFLIPVADTLFITLMVVTFFSIVGGSLIPNKFLLDIWNAQEPERMEALREAQRRYASYRDEREARQAEARAAAATSQTQAQSLPPPVTAVRFLDTSASALAAPTPSPASAEPQPPTFGTLYTTNALILLGVFFLTGIALTTFPPFLLYIYTRTISLLYLSPWLPQIMRSARRNTTRALTMRFIIGQSALRLLPFAWLWGRPDSWLPGILFSWLGLGGGGCDVLNVQPDPIWILVLAAWLWLQFLVIAIQDVLGARWFTWQGWPWNGNLPEAWNWGDVSRLRTRGRAPPRTQSEEEATSGLDPVPPAEGDMQPVVKIKSADERSYECAICMLHVDVPLTSQSSVGAAGSVLLGIKSKHDFMITPCAHVFHKECLEGWMGYRLQCPVCREGLPPL